MLLPDSVESEAHEVVHEVVMGGDIIEEGLDFVGFFVGGYGLGAEGDGIEFGGWYLCGHGGIVA